MYHIAVCDDNQEEAHLIGRMTQEIMAQRKIEAQVDLFFDPESLLDKLQQTQIQYDLFLLDILMEERNGIQLAQAFRQRGYRGKLIYITASRDYAIDGYKVKADDYLLKPVEKDTLDQAIGRVLPRLETVLLETTGDMKILQLQQILSMSSPQGIMCSSGWGTRENPCVCGPHCFRSSKSWGRKNLSGVTKGIW